MAFYNALALVKELEGKGKSGEQYGMTQATWEALKMHGNVTAASDFGIECAYRRLWKQYPDLENPARVVAPADAVAFQMLINLPYGAGVDILRMAIMMDGDMSQNILQLQANHYRVVADHDILQGLLNRVSRVDTWLSQQTKSSPVQPPSVPSSEPSAPESSSAKIS